LSYARLLNFIQPAHPTFFLLSPKTEKLP